MSGPPYWVYGNDSWIATQLLSPQWLVEFEADAVI